MVIITTRTINCTTGTFLTNRLVSDYDNIDQLSDIKDMYQLFKNYKSNLNVEGQNKYANLYYSLDPYMTPFYNSTISNDVFNSQSGTIIEGNVNDNITAIVDSLGDLYSTIASNNELIKLTNFSLLFI